jgi:hypothetical protein
MTFFALYLGEGELRIQKFLLAALCGGACVAQLLKLSNLQRALKCLSMP